MRAGGATIAAMQNEPHGFESVSRHGEVLLRAVPLYVILFITWSFILVFLASMGMIAWRVPDWLVVTAALALVTEVVIAVWRR